MPTSQLYKLSALSTPAGLVPSLMSRSINPGLEAYVLRGDGRISPLFRATMSQSPMFSATTVAIGAALTAFGSGFYAFSAAVELYLAKLVSGGGVGAGAVHAKVGGNKGAILPRRIRAEHGRVATFDFDGYWLSADGIAAPFAYTGSVALPAMAVPAQSYTLGLASINGSALGALKSFELEWGFQEIVHSSGGEMYPTFCCYSAYQPIVRVTTSDPAILATVGVGGVAQGATPSRFHFQKLAPAGRVAATTAEHIRLSMTAGYFEPGAISEDDDGETTMELTAMPLDDGTNAIMAVSLASAMA